MKYPIGKDLTNRCSRGREPIDNNIILLLLYYLGSLIKVYNLIIIQYFSKYSKIL